MSNILTLLFDPFAGPAGFNGTACIIWLTVAAMAACAWFERPKKPHRVSYRQQYGRTLRKPAEVELYPFRQDTIDAPSYGFAHPPRQQGKSAGMVFIMLDTLEAGNTGVIHYRGKIYEIKRTK